MIEQVIIRPGGPGDIPAVLALLDLAGEWLVAQGRTGQWGTQRQSTSERRLAQAPIWADSGGLYLALLGDVPVGALVVGLPADFAPSPDEPDLYVNLLVTDRRHSGQGLGALLLDHARTLARAAGIGLLRLDCYAGDDRKLVRYYESQGFTATVALQFGHWPGQLLEQKLRAF
jgi:GNAT superfamily N-acetyltransferase